MKFFKNESGYALFITLAILILFTALGMTMLILSSSGMKKNEVRKETVQADALAEKGIEEIIAEINSYLNKEIINGINKSSFIVLLNNLVEGKIVQAEIHSKILKCPEDLSKLPEILKNNGKQKDYKACIVNGMNSPKDDLHKIVEFKSLGKSGSTLRVLTNTIEIGAEAYPTNLKYALSANATPNSRLPDEGNLMFHGGSDITGDIKADGNIFVYYIATDVGLKRFESTHPNLKANKTGSPPKIFLAEDKNLYTVEIPFPKWYESDYWQANEYKKYLDNPHAFGRSPALADIKSNLFLTPIKPIIVKNKNDMSSYIDVDSQFKNNVNGIEIEKDDLRIKSGVHSFPNGLHVKGDLLIGNLNNSDNKSKVSLKGKIYVDGNVIIKGADLDSNVILYVKGKVDISYTEIKPEKSTKKPGTLFIFSNGSIRMSDISTGQGSPSILNGFFYSQDNFEVHARASHIEINGGISARRIVLNAVRNGSEKNTSPSRLRVVYDENVINNYLDLNKLFSNINKVDSPFELDREIEKFIKK